MIGSNGRMYEQVAMIKLKFRKYYWSTYSGQESQDAPLQDLQISSPAHTGLAVISRTLLFCSYLDEK